MTVAHFDLGLRLRALTVNRPVPRVAMQPVAPFSPRVYVKTAHGSTSVHSASGTASAADADGLLAALARAGLGTADPVSLIVEDRATRAALNAAARSASEQHTHYAVAAHLGWSLGRADVAATSALVDLPALLARTWALPVGPALDREPSVHRRWHQVTDAGPAGMASLLSTIRTLPENPLLAQIAVSDAADWNAVHTDLLAGRDWRQPDDRKRAAVGLAVRNAAAEVLDAALLADRRYRRIAVERGDVAQGRLATVNKREFVVVIPRLDVRLRAGARLKGWAGPAGFDHPRPFNCTLTDTDTVGSDLHLSCSSKGRAALPPPGAVVTLVPAGPVGNVAASARTTAALYNQRFSWLTTGRAPITHRRDVPLEVLVAAATDDPEE